jgi:DNA-binding CsgD family transcriptional regulator
MEKSNSLPSPSDIVPPRAWRRLNDAVYQINAANGHTDLSRAVVAALVRLVRADTATFHALHRESGRSILRMVPEDAFTAEEIACYFAAPEEMPLAAYYARTGATHALRLSDVIPTREFRKSAYYRKCHSRLGLAYTLALPLQVDAETVIGLTLNRSKRNFSIQDRALLDAFGPHVILAWQRHGDPWEEPSPRPACPRQLWVKRGLTKRECDVLWWMTEGKQNVEIAAILGISLATVQKHVAHLVRKLRAENRHAATVLALRDMMADG